MTQAQVEALINSVVYTNANQEITAALMNPMLIAMLTQPNDAIGDLGDLDTTTQTNLVSAINEVFNIVDSYTTEITVHTGTNDPNVVPPASFQAPDIYKRVVAGDVLGVWMYNGTSWISIIPTENPPEKHVTIGGNLFEWRQHPNNAGNDDPDNGDVALNGWIDENTWGKLLSFQGGDWTDINNWEILEQVG